MRGIENGILVTGATGFVGTRVVALLLANGKSVRALTRDPRKAQRLWPGRDVHVLEGDLVARTGLDEACHGVEAVLHLASYSPVDAPDRGERGHWQTTVEGTRALLASAERQRVRKFVFVSSVVAAMEELSEGVSKARATPTPTMHYGRAKLAAERLVLASGMRRGTHAAVLRLPPVYGSHEFGNLPRMMRAVANGSFPPLPRVENRRSMVHVDDAARALLAVLESAAADGKTYVVTDGNAYSTRQIYEWMCGATGRAPHRSVPLWFWRVLAGLGDAVGRLGWRRVPFNSDVFGSLFGSSWHSSQAIVDDLGFRAQCGLREYIEEMGALCRADSKGHPKCSH